MMNASDRAQAAYHALSSQGSFSALNQQEKAQVLAQLQVLLGADLSYLTGNAEIDPGSLAAQPGASVSTPMGPGAVTSPSSISGVGVLR